MNPKFLSLLPATDKVIDSSSRESTLEPLSLGWGVRVGGRGGGEGGRRKRRRHPRNMKRLLEKEETVTLWDGGHRSGGEEPERRGVRESP